MFSSPAETMAAAAAPRIHFEGCVDSVASAVAAEKGGADRVELCSGLVDGGLTPSIGLIRATVAAVRIPVNVFVRPRPGDFAYSAAELDVIEHDILACRQVVGLHGVVIGVLRPDGSVDMKAMRRLLSQCGSLFVSFSRAIDYVPDAVACLKDLLTLNSEFPNLKCVLTSGQQNNVADGAALLKQLVAVSGGRIDVMAGAGLTEQNAVQLVAATGVRWIHGSLRHRVPSVMQFQRPNVFLGGAKQNVGTETEYALQVCSSAKVKNVITSVNASLRAKL